MHQGVKQAMNVTVSKPSKALRICDADGVPVSTAFEERIVVRDHFAKQLGGVVVSFRDSVCVVLLRWLFVFMGFLIVSGVALLSLWLLWFVSLVVS